MLEQGCDRESSPSATTTFCDETRCPILDPGRGKAKTGFMWAIARDDRPWGGTDLPAVAYTYAPGRGGEHAVKLLAGLGRRELLDARQRLGA